MTNREIMEISHELKIPGFSNPVAFVDRWSEVYSYGNEEKYSSHIDSVLESKTSFIELFRWKNGTGDKIAEKKYNSVEAYWEKRDVLLKLRENFEWSEYEKAFLPAKTANIWKIFLLHLVNPGEFPIYDQHVFRFYYFHKYGLVQEIPTGHKERYLGYRNDYYLWFNDMKAKYGLNPKKMDKAFFSFGKFLKSLRANPYLVQMTGGSI